MILTKRSFITFLLPYFLIEASLTAQSHYRDTPSNQENTEFNLPKSSYNGCTPTQIPIANRLRQAGEWVSLKEFKKEDESNNERYSCCLWNCEKPFH